MTTQLPCTKAIIPVAGFGTRRLPLTKAIEKCMIPVGNRPVIDYVVQDCIKAGITDIFFVVGEDFEQLKQYYGRNISLEEHLTNKGKQAELEEIRQLSHGARFHYIIQDSYLPYGTSVPVHLARDFIRDDEKFVVVFGDQFFYHQDGGSELASLMARGAETEALSVMLAVEVPREEVTNYGVIATHPGPNGAALFDHIVERPATVAEAPSNLNNASFFIFDKAILPFVTANVEKEMKGEHYLTDAINDYVSAGNTLAVLRAEGKYLDCGTVQGWLDANNHVLGNA
jgi:UTP--glucose-1-phosphate uridylyltransferase